MEQLELILPHEIEQRSFEIITQELEEKNIVLDRTQEAIIKRVIHTSADFEYAHTMCFSNNAIEQARELLRQGAYLITDTNMALAGINKPALARYQVEARCFMAEERIALLAQERQQTRAAVSMEEAAKLDRPVVFVIGNAPTALVSLYELYRTGRYKPAFIIGVPVGFVNVVQAKELILGTDIPYIINRGRKGGSNVAAAICNALLYGMNP